jgi:anthranilate synthase/aminodeoxychorismate synthase-like glutamine amidotransferase
MFILIDNYDSFTWNLWHFLSDLGAEVEIVRNDAATPDEVLARAPQGLVLSPGPGTPQDAGITIELIRAAAGNTPVLGVCLGHQALAAAFGGTLRRVDPPVHGKLSRVKRTYANAVKSDLFADCPTDFPVTRYHSLVVEEDSLPDELTVTARTEAGAVMGLSHRDHDLHGVQFHPESIASVAGYRILANFLRVCGMTVPTGEDMAALESQVLRLDERFPGQMHQ